MRIHNDRHHSGYVAGLNAALALEALQEDTRTLVRTNGGGHLNRSLFWESMAADDRGLPADPLAEAIDGTYGSIRYYLDWPRVAARYATAAIRSARGDHE